MARLFAFTFVFVTGALLFAAGGGRLVGLASVGLAVFTWVARWRRLDVQKRANLGEPFRA